MKLWTYEILTLNLYTPIVKLSRLAGEVQEWCQKQGAASFTELLEKLRGKLRARFWSRDYGLGVRFLSTSFGAFSRCLEQCLI